MSEDPTPRLPLLLRLRLTWWRFLWWTRRCPDCDRQGWDPASPRWDEDNVVQLLELEIQGRCGACGRQLSDQGTTT